MASTVLFASLLHAKSPRHVQNMVQGILAAVQRHSVVKQGLSDEQPQRIISKIYDEARALFGGSSVGTRELEVS